MENTSSSWLKTHYVPVQYFWWEIIAHISSRFWCMRLEDIGGLILFVSVLYLLLTLFLLCLSFPSLPLFLLSLSFSSFFLFHLFLYLSIYLTIYVSIYLSIPISLLLSVPFTLSLSPHSITTILSRCLTYSFFSLFLSSFLRPFRPFSLKWVILSSISAYIHINYYCLSINIVRNINFHIPLYLSQFHTIYLSLLCYTDSHVNVYHWTLSPTGKFIYKA